MTSTASKASSGSNGKARPSHGSVDKLRLLLELWSRMSSHLRMRDRTVKILQYGCQMLAGYYGGRMSRALLESVTLTRGAASNARKALWMLKPLVHVNDVLGMLRRPQPMSLLEGVDCFEAVMWILYYVFENLIFLARLRIQGFKESNFDFPCNVCWFIGDTAFMGTTAFRLFARMLDYSHKAAELRDVDASDEDSHRLLSDELCVIRRDLVDKGMAFIIVSPAHHSPPAY